MELMLLKFLFCTGLFKVALSECQLDLALQGQFHRQISRPVYESKQQDQFPDAEVFEKIILSSSSSSVWGDCYAKLDGNAYVFGQPNKNPINIRPLHPEFSSLSPSMCFRCITLIAHTSNVLQSMHQDEEICHESVETAEKSCFLASQIHSSVDGRLLFRSDYYDSSSCHLDGMYSVAYRLQDLDSSSSFECTQHSGSQMSNCDQRSRLQFNFKNCSFPDFDQTLVCLGTWPVGKQIQLPNSNYPVEYYLAVLNLATQQYKCGVMQQWTNRTTKIFLSADSSCSGLLKDGSNALEDFTLIQEKSHLEHSQCDFPPHLLGEYGDGRLTISSSQIQDKQNGGSSPSVVSVCIMEEPKNFKLKDLYRQLFLPDEHGAPLGFHCLWFRPRSESVLEFKTTPTVSEPSQTMCSNDHEFEQVPWTTSVSNKPQKSLCGFFGQYSTPREMWLGGDCYSLSVDCDQLNNFKLVAFHCQTGEAYDARTYTCLGTWKEDELMFVYTQTDSTSTSTNKKSELFCFISQQHDGNLFVAPVGSHCERDFNFTANSDKTIILNQQQYCRSELGSGDVIPKTKTENKNTLQQIQHSQVVSEYERAEDTNNQAQRFNGQPTILMIIVAIFLLAKPNC